MLLSSLTYLQIVCRHTSTSCLDRTNVAQFSAGVEAMGQQLVVMGIRSNPKLDPSSNIVRVLIDMYVDIGDHIALQYGGSEAHKKVSSERSESIAGPIGKVRLCEAIVPYHMCIEFFLTNVISSAAQRAFDVYSAIL